jgi:hypothetical protein
MNYTKELDKFLLTGMSSRNIPVAKVGLLERRMVTSPLSVSRLYKKRRELRV